MSQRRKKTSSESRDLSGVEILVLDYEASVAEAIARTLEGLGARVFTASSRSGATHVLDAASVSVILASIDMVDEETISLISEYKRKRTVFFYVLTEHEYDTIETSNESVRSAIDDYISRPIDLTRFSRMVQAGLGRPSTGSTSLAVVEPLITKVKPYFLFRSAAMRRALANLPEIAASGQTVLISGETGTGKELVARAIHMLSPRINGPFVPINCGAIPETLIEGELFGHEKGAFTGAHRSRKGKFESADHGTLFLDEIADMPIDLQGRLLRVLEEGKVTRVGGDHPISIDVRVIAATRVELQKAVSSGLFREDLYYRLNVLRIHLPLLRERSEDIPLLSVHFLERALTEMGRKPPFPILSDETIYLLESYPWKGNVRELRNIMTRVATLLPPHTKRVFPVHILPHLEDAPRSYESAQQRQTQAGVVIPFGARMAQAEDMIIAETLKLLNGNRSKAARMLGISLRTLRRKLNKENKL